MTIARHCVSTNTLGVASVRASHDIELQQAAPTEAVELSIDK